MQAQSLQAVSTTDADLATLIQKQRAYFRTGATKSIPFRVAQLKKLKQAVLDHQDLFLEALQKDLNKPVFEAYAAEIGYVINEVNEAIKETPKWAKPKRVLPNLLNLPAMGSIHSDPLGVVLIIGPWNYPLQLALAPLIGAISAGNCAIIKASEYAPHTSAALNTVISNLFDEAYVALVEGGVEASQSLLRHPFDHIFFTGSTQVGRIVMAAAAKHLSPVTLELGGKSPCIIEGDADLDLAARRVAFGKFMNAGQTCIAPDYILVQNRVKDGFIAAMQRVITEFFGEDPQQSPDYCRIISDKHHQRLVGFLKADQILFGGEADGTDRYIAPTLMHNLDWDDAIMQEEIFGPLLPILTYDHIDEAIEAINDRPKPLALYLFGNQKAVQNKVLRDTSSGGVCINDTLLHMSMPGLPFGGVGESGIGAYHGKASFDVFSHQKSVMWRPSWGDVAFRYAPYSEKSLAIIKKAFGVG